LIRKKSKTFQVYPMFFLLLSLTVRLLLELREGC